MTAQPSVHDRYVAKVNNLVAIGRDDMIDEIVSHYAHDETPGREVFWSRLGRHSDWAALGHARG